VNIYRAESKKNSSSQFLDAFNDKSKCKKYELLAFGV